MNNSTQKKVVTGVVAAIIAVVIFFGGVKYGQAHGRDMTFNFQGRGQVGANATFVGRGFGGARGGQMAGVVAGQILSKDATNFTVKLPTGGSKIVFTSGGTEIMKQVSGTSADLSVGTNVVVQGAANSDGSITAQSVQIRPVGMFGSTTPNR